MNRRHLPFYAIALAILIVGLAYTGVPLPTILFGLLVLGCPLMMMFMMGGHGGHGGRDQPSDSREQHDHDRRTGGLR